MRIATNGSEKMNDSVQEEIKRLLFGFLDNYTDNMGLQKIIVLVSLLNECISQKLINTLKDYYLYNLMNNLFSKHVIESNDVDKLVDFYFTINLLDIAKICIHDSNSNDGKNYEEQKILEICDNSLNTLLDIYDKHRNKNTLICILDQLNELIHHIFLCNPKFLNYIAKEENKEIILENQQHQQMNTKFSICKSKSKEIVNDHKANILKKIHQKINNCIQNKSQDLILEHSTIIRFASNLEKPVKAYFYFNNGVYKQGCFHLKWESTCYQCYFSLKNFLKTKDVKCSLSWLKKVRRSDGGKDFQKFGTKHKKQSNTIMITFEGSLVFEKEESELCIEVKENQKSEISSQEIIESLIGLVDGKGPFPRNDLN